MEFSQRFDCPDAVTAVVQTCTIPQDGLYKLEVYGACGGACRAYSNINSTPKPGGYGGGSVGYKYLKKGTLLYIVVGGTSYQGSFDGVYPVGYGGANGGGASKDILVGSTFCSNGGGATHIATTNRGELKNYNNFKSEVLIVAGGGGGGGISYDDGIQIGYGAGGAGGGLVGGNGTDGWWTQGAEYAGAGAGGTQTSGGRNVEFPNQETFGAFGAGGYNTFSYQPSSGGGGGWYGGGYGIYKPEEDGVAAIGGAGGGSGYIGGVPAITYRGITYVPETTTGVNQTGSHGWAVITLVKKSTPTVRIGTKEVIEIRIGDKEVTGLRIGDKEL